MKKIIQSRAVLRRMILKKTQLGKIFSIMRMRKRNRRRSSIIIILKKTQNPYRKQQIKKMIIFK